MHEDGDAWAIKGTRIGAEVTEALNGYGLPVLESRITQRVSYPGTAAKSTKRPFSDHCRV